MRYHRIVVTVFLLPLFIISSQAQELCEALVREAFEAVTANCGNLENANACYGFDSISASFFESGLDASFHEPSDSVNLENIQTVRTSPFDEEEEEWGISYFRIDIPESSEPLVIMSAGDVIVENAVTVADASGLGLMQAFNFTTGGESDCREAPNAVYIQGPRDVEVNLLINSIPIRMGSTLVLGTYEEDGQDTMWLGVVEGHALINPNSENPNLVPEGAITTSPLTNENGDSPNGTNILDTRLVPVIDPVTGEQVIGPDGEPFFRQVPYTEFSEPEEIGFDEEDPITWETLSFVEDIPSDLVNYDVEIPVEEPEVTEVPTELPNVETVVVLPEASDTSVPVNDGQVTECGTLNWCNAGEPWGDGRCNDPDPNVSNWYWNAGWYQAQLECGAIASIPDSFLPPEPATPSPQQGALANSGFFVEITNCLNQAGTTSFILVAHNMPSDMNLVGVRFGVTYYNVLNPANPPGPQSGSFNLDTATETPLTGAFVGFSSVVGLTTVPLSGPASC